MKKLKEILILFITIPVAIAIINRIKFKLSLKKWLEND